MSSQIKKSQLIKEIELFFGFEFTLVQSKYKSGSYRREHYHSQTIILNANEVLIGIEIPELNIEDISILAKCKDLVFINLTGNSVKDISPLSELRSLKTLYLGGNKINDISPLVYLKKLELLTIWTNPIEDFSYLKQLKSLKELYCQSIDLEDFEFIKYLPNLREIALDENFVSDLSPLITNSSLQIASLTRNNISDLTPIENLKSNITLELDRNKITTISIAIAKHFGWLDIKDHRRYQRNRSTPPYLSIQENPLKMPPNSVLELGSDTVENYYEACQNFGHAPLSEGRIIFIGDGSSGKSSLIEKILFDTFKLGREQTNGIKIDHLKVEHPVDGRELTFNIWDFGGQEIQHAVHKFFFTEGCLYVLVLDNRKEEEPEYWLQQIESLAARAPVIIVFNKQDENSAETADRKYLKVKYPNIVSFHNTSCKEDIGISDFKNELKKQVVKLDTVDEQFPTNWLHIKRAIQNGTSGINNYLKYEDFKKICDEFNTSNESAQKLLLKYFNTIGSVTWFGEDTHLKFFHVLNPAWITQGVYKILTAKKTASSFGKIEINDFPELLEPKTDEDYKYIEENYIYLLNMMKKFELCDSSNDRNLLIPSAFGKIPKVEYNEYKGANIRTYILQFKDYMPLALIHRFTAKKISEALEDNYWYTGIVIKDSQSQTSAMVHADKEAKRIYIRIKGSEKLGMWEYIRRDLATITKSYAKVPYEELVAIDNNVENNVSYADLKSYMQSNKPVYFHPRLQKDYNIGFLIGLFETKEGTLDKVRSGAIEIVQENNVHKDNIPPFVINILNNNNPTVTTQINNQINIDIQLIQQIGSDLKGDATYLKNELNDSPSAELLKALQSIIEFANDSKDAKNVSTIKEKGWGRKLKSVMETLAKSGDEIKKISDGNEALNSLFKGVKELAANFNLHDITEWFKTITHIS